MNKVVKLNKMDFCYWVDELPTIKLNNEKEKVFEISRTNTSLGSNIKLALELSLHRHISSYAMLGINYIPMKNANKLVVIIKYIDKNETNYLSEISLNSSEYVYCGLEKFFLSTIVDTIIDFNDTNCLPAGILKFEVAANCEVSSSPLIFCGITKILLSLLVNIDKEKLILEGYFEQLIMNTIKNSGIFN